MPDFFLRLYDRTVRNWFAGIVTESLSLDLSGDNGLMVVLAPPQRAHASLRNLMQEGSNTPTRTSEVQTNIDLPAISIFRTVEPTFDFQRFTGRHDIIRQLGYEGNPSGTEGLPRERIYQAEQPLPVLLEYQVDLWTYRLQESNLVQRAYFKQFRPWKRLCVDYGDFWGEKWLSVENLGVVNNSDLEPGTNKTEYRYSFSFRFYGHCFSDPTLTRTIETICVSYYHGTEDEHFEGDTSGAILLNKQAIPSGTCL